jgi:hypothetical protein
MNRNLLPILVAVGALCAPAAANAETLVADPAATQAATLGGTIVWITGAAPQQKLMMRAPDGTVSALNSPVSGYRDVDLGRDSDGKLIATYARCTTPSKCIYLWDDLDGRRASFSHLPFKDCELSTTPARWRTRVVFGLGCFKRVKGKKVADNARSGLYYRQGTGKRIRLTAPKAVRAAGADSVTSVDIRGTNVAAVYADIAAYAVLRGVAAGSPAVAIRVGSSEGDTDQRARNVVLASTTTLFALTDSSYGGEPAQSIVNRQTAQCHDYQVLTGPSEDESPLLDLTAEGQTEYAVTPGVGITTFDYKPDVGC